jgi:hypothetical protein
MIFPRKREVPPPLVLDLAGDAVPVAVTCRVLGFSTQAFYRWKKQPVMHRDSGDAHLIDNARDIHADNPHSATASSQTNYPTAVSPATGSRGCAHKNASGRCSRRSEA